MVERRGPDEARRGRGGRNLASGECGWHAKSVRKAIFKDHSCFFGGRVERSLQAARPATFVCFVLDGTLMGMWLVQMHGSSSQCVLGLADPEAYHRAGRWRMGRCLGLDAGHRAAGGGRLPSGRAAEPAARAHL